jgi:TolB-like protein
MVKRCPVCHREYADETLNFCLDDGTALLEGPAWGNEATAILAPEASTQVHNVKTGSSKNAAATTSAIAKPDRKLIVGVVGILIVALAAVVTYWLYGHRASNQIDSIAVMPFVNDSQAPELEYLSDGIAESLMNSLSQLPGLSVKARSSAFRYKGKETDAQTIGKELGVQAILNGRVVKRGDNLTLFLELVDTNSGDRKWGEQYSEPIADLISLQNRIARDVSQKLSIKLSGADQKKLGKSYTANAEAYQLYLQGRFFLNKRTPEAFRNAIPLFEQAIAIDSNYALAFAGLSDSYALLANYPGGLPPKEGMPKAKDAALKALQLDSELAEAHESLAHVLDQHEFDWAAAESEYKRAIALNPNLASAHQWYSELLTAFGRHDESLSETQRALDLDPLSLIINMVKGRNLLLADRVDEAIEQLKRTAALDPSFPAVHGVLADAYRSKEAMPRALKNSQDRLS